ncbi:hypothetical protein BFP97_08585 [Roseivirga sp. 4D4]|uniref:hypothetical protein n=1 Tax=Roseivirga sp. 4D4 TaxID=1889784 RepID=UPI000853284A|nr:hypothetical protein [Roseivirga sp. 4D4]OEK01570.1 hypothetical protein BFP97_08585 [Roseivirga sp. 4D4]
MEEQLEEQNVDGKVEPKPILVTKLSKELLFTLGNLEKQARELRDEPFVINRHKPMLDDMVEEAHRMDGLLQALRRALRSLKSDEN